MSSDGEVVGTNEFSVLVDDVAGGDARLLFGFYDYKLAQTCCFVGFYTVGHTFDDIFEFCYTGAFGYDYGVERIPFSNDFAFLHYVAFVCKEFGTVGYVL